MGRDSVSGAMYSLESSRQISLVEDRRSLAISFKDEKTLEQVNNLLSVLLLIFFLLLKSRNLLFHTVTPKYFINPIFLSLSRLV